jgi:hypothetical protein
MQQTGLCVGAWLELDGTLIPVFMAPKIAPAQPMLLDQASAQPERQRQARARCSIDPNNATRARA